MQDKLTQLLLKGYQARKATRLQESRSSSTPAFRAGNSGCITKGGLIIGSCPREAMMRYHGISKPSEYSTSLMFEAGEMNEMAVIQNLQAAEAGTILTQKEAGTKWAVSYNDVEFPVTGSPDIVVQAADGKLEFGIELKNVSAYWTARDVGPFANQKPKLAHLTQAAHYMWQLGQRDGREYLPYYLTYVSRMNWVTMGYKDFPEDHPAIQRNSSGKPFKLVPFYSHYELKLENGTLFYRQVEGTNWQKSMVDIQGIQDYYALLAECVAKEMLPPRMDLVDNDGSPMSYDPYSEDYNAWHHLHEAYDRGEIGYEQFVSKTKQLEEIF